MPSISLSVDPINAVYIASILYKMYKQTIRKEIRAMRNTFRKATIVAFAATCRSDGKDVKLDGTL